MLNHVSVIVSIVNKIIFHFLLVCLFCWHL